MADRYGITELDIETESKSDSKFELESDSPVTIDTNLKDSADRTVATSEFRLTPTENRTEWIQTLTLCYSLFVVGWNDGSTGPLIPTYQRIYGVGYTIVSLLFIFNCLVSSEVTA